MSQPCKHGSVCTDALNSYSCDCNGTGYGGLNCEVNVDECQNQVQGQGHECQNEAVCVDIEGSYRCQCLQGYTGKNSLSNLLFNGGYLKTIKIWRFLLTVVMVRTLF